MSTISVDYDVLNQKGSPAWFSDTFANIPTFGYKGRMFISIDTFAFYRDTGTGWDLIGGPGIGTLTGSGTTGQVSFFNGTQVLTGNNNLFWDNTNSRLGINTATPGQALDVHSTANTLVQLNNTTTADSIIAFQNQNVTKWKIGNLYNAGANSFDITNPILTTTPFSISSAGAITLASNVTTTGAQLVQNGLYLTNAQAGAQAFYTTIWGRNEGVNFGLRNGTGGASFIFPSANGYDYTFPATAGTIALTSNLSAYLPLAGGTLTGALIGTSATFSSGITSVGGSNQEITASATGDFFPRLKLIRTAGTTKTNRNYSFDIGSTGSITLEDNTASATRLTIDTTGAASFSSTILAGQGTFQSTGANIISKNTTTSQSNFIRYDNSVGGARAYLGYETTGTDFYIENAEGKLLLATNSGTAMTLSGTTADFLTTTASRYLQIRDAGASTPSLRSVNDTIAQLRAIAIEANTISLRTGASSGLTVTEALGISATGTITLTSLGTGAVTATGGVLSTTSDMNLKIEDGYIDNALDKILKLTPRYFYWKEESNLPTDLRQLGFYAQEVNEALGEEVANTPKDENQNWGIYDRGIIAMLTKAMQELNKKLVRNNIN